MEWDYVHGNLLRFGFEECIVYGSGLGALGYIYVSITWIHEYVTKHEET